MPVAIAPTGLTGMQHADGEILAARAAEKFGIPFTLSMMSICSIEDIAANTKAPFWFQPYMLKDRAFMERLFERAVVRGHKTERDENLREQLAQFLHEHHERTAKRDAGQADTV